MNNLLKLIIISIVLMPACSDSNTLDSDNFGSVEDRIKVLNDEIRLLSDVKDAEFELFNVNGFKNKSGGSIAGPSYSDYKIALKVDTADIRNWQEGMEKFDATHVDQKWIKEIVKNRDRNWRTNSQPIFYTQKGYAGWSTTLITFRTEGIIFMRIITN